MTGEAEILIVGGGIAGASAAYHLAAHGRRVTLLERGEVAYIHAPIALHRVRPFGSEPAVALHLYARPIDVCQVFEELTGAVLSRQLIYHSAGP